MERSEPEDSSEPGDEGSDGLAEDAAHPSASGEVSDGDDDDSGEQLAAERRAAGRGEPIAADNHRLRGQVATHRAQLESLKQKDPEFWA
jgi:nucleolar complex protein 2